MPQPGFLVGFIGSLLLDTMTWVSLDLDQDWMSCLLHCVLLLRSAVEN